MTTKKLNFFILNFHEPTTQNIVLVEDFFTFQFLVPDM